MSELPNWVMDLVMALEKWEDEGHDMAKAAQEELDRKGSVGMDTTRAACHHAWFELIPDDVRNQARAIRAYRDQADREKEPGDVE